MNLFREVKLRADIKPKVRKCDWGDPTDVAFYMVETRQEERNKILDKLVPKRICPLCDRMRINSKSWVVNKKKTRAVCRSCYMRKIPDKRLEESSRLKYKIFGNTILRYKIKPRQMVLARVEAGISVREFASFAGWTAVYQYKLEDGSVKTIAGETAETIMEVFARFGFYTEDEL